MLCRPIITQGDDQPDDYLYAAPVAGIHFGES